MVAVTRHAPVEALRGPRPVPLLGPNGNLVRFFRDPVGMLLNLHRSYGAFAALGDRDPSYVCMFDPAHYREVLSDPARFHNFADLPFPAPADSSAVRLLGGLTAMNGDTHKRHRRLMMPAFQKGRLESYRDDVVRVVDRLFARWEPGKTIDLSAQMTSLSLCVAMQCLFDLDMVEHADEMGALGVGFLEQLTSVGVMALPFDLPGLPYRRFLRTSEHLEGRLRKLIDERRKRASPGRDVLSLLVAARDEDGSTLSDAELVGQASVMFVAAYETTAHTLTWASFLLAQHPEIYAALLDELSGALHGEAPTLAQQDSLPLLDGVIKETMRLLPATPFLFLRKSTQSFTLGPHTLPEGAQLILSPLIVHRIPERYPDPERFVPKRWETLDPDTYEYLPFGAGPRMCIGAGFAGMVLRVVLPMLVQRFRLSVAANANVSRQVRGITLGPKYGMSMSLAKQDRAFAVPVRVRGDIHELVQLPK
jgi:cytochrome P450